MASQGSEAAPTEPVKKRKSSKFGFKNGLKSLTAAAKKKVKKNDTVQHFTGKEDELAAQSAQQQQAQSGGSSRKRKNSKVKAPMLPKLPLENYTFPKEILPPSESWGRLAYDAEDEQIHSFLISKYQNEIHKLTFFPDDILIRFTLSQRGMTPYAARQQETERQFKIYLRFHRENHYDDVLTHPQLNGNKSLSSLKENITALPLFIYGQDKQGHPIFWDDGSAFAKETVLDAFKNDMPRVELFRARLMKRMHNVKLAASKNYGKMIYKHCLVMDLSRFNAKKFVKDRKFHEQNTKQISDLFPEVLHRLYVINAPWAFRSAWKVIQTFLHPVTAQKTKILGKDYISELSKDIQLDMIPHSFGGIGPYDIVYGETPLAYPFSHEDNDFKYAALPKNTLPVPPREAAPDMNKHKAKQMKAMKASGMDMDGMDVEDWEQKSDDGDEEEVEATLGVDALKMASHAQSEPVGKSQANGNGQEAKSNQD